MRENGNVMGRFGFLWFLYIKRKREIRENEMSF